ncbi:hypothetical protein [uncultured Mycobacterium sp.]|uniref:hypothetical protein n=1 Tax=uncultured Mycobacterium sp. TaxID=171292 RepID=UPI0035CB423A
MKGASVCRVHGGAAPQVKAKARQRLEEAADRMARELLGIATGAESEAVKLAAIRDALDRAGVSAKQTLELSATAEPKPYEEMLVGIAGIATVTREESRAARGLPAPETPELPPPPLARELPEVVDAELVPEGPTGPAHSPTDGLNAAEGRRVPSDQPQPPTPPPGLVTMEEAVTETRIRQVRRTTRRYR